jgi:hypothetical protein
MSVQPAPGAPPSTIKRIVDVVTQLHVPHHLMPSKPFDLLLNAGALFVVGTFIINLGRWSIATTSTELSQNILATVACYAIMAVGGVLAILISPNATFQEDAAKFTSLVYFLFLATVLLYAVVSVVVYQSTGETAVTLMRELASPWLTRLLICSMTSIAAIGLFARRTRLFTPDGWKLAPNKTVWMIVYWVLTSLCAAFALSVSDDM